MLRGCGMLSEQPAGAEARDPCCASPGFPSGPGRALLVGGAVAPTSMERDTSRIWDECSGPLRAYLRRSLRDPADVDDVLQDVFLKIHRHAAGLGAEVHLPGWIFAVARNAVVDHQRRRRGVELSSAAEPVTEEEPDRSTHAEIAGTLRALLRELPEKYAQAVILVDLEGKPFREVAQLLGLSVSGAKSRAQRGRAMVREALLRCCHFVLDRYGTIVDAEHACCVCVPPRRPAARG